MSDLETGGRGPCPVCRGDGQETIGPLTMLCHECGGEGSVGGEESAGREDGHEYDPTADGPLAPVGQHPAVVGLCPACLGARKVISLGAAGLAVEQPCPLCG
jgi:RecJ-like exonuclease